MDSSRHEKIRQALIEAGQVADQVTATWSQGQAGQDQGQDQEGRQQVTRTGSEARTATIREGLDDDGPMIPGPYQVGSLVSVLPERQGPVWVGRWQGLNVNGSAVIRHEVHGYRLYVPADGLSRIMASPGGDRRTSIVEGAY